MKERILELIAEHSGIPESKAEQIKPTDLLELDLYMDSIDMCGLAGDLELEFNACIDNVDILQCETVSDVFDTVERLMK